tara:strand:- start:355 stop:600 length:246 start_codon:yes stop_codon:yes gene_type:complete
MGLNSGNTTSRSSGFNRTSKNKESIEDAAFSSVKKGERRVNRRSQNNSSINPGNVRSSSKSSYSSSTRNPRPRDNNSRFDD